MAPRLATATVLSRLLGLRGRAVLSAKSHHTIVDSPLSLGGPNEELNPVDLLMGSLATSATFLCERVAQERGVALVAISVSVTGSYDPKGMTSEPVDPRLQAIKLRIQMNGPTSEQAETLVEGFKARCPVYATLSRAVSIEVEMVVDRNGGKPTGAGK